MAAALIDEAAFHPLSQRYLDPVYRYCLRRLGNKDSAQDATSQTFMKVLAALPTFRADKSSFRSWLFAITHNVLVDFDRARNRTRTWEMPIS